VIGRRGNRGVYSGGGDKDVSNTCKDQIEEHRVSTQKSYYRTKTKTRAKRAENFLFVILEHFKDLLQPGDTEWIS